MNPLLKDYVPKGDIEGFPLEVLDLMLTRQFEQTGKYDLGVFEVSRNARESIGGFDWNTSDEGDDFWFNVISYLEFTTFFDRYPKELPESTITSFKEILTHKDACSVLSKAQYEATTDQMITDIFNACNKLTGFKSDYNNPKQKKWRPAFIMDGAGLRYVYPFCDDFNTYIIPGSRLCHKVSSKEEAIHIGQVFFDLHKQHYFGE